MTLFPFASTHQEVAVVLLDIIGSIEVELAEVGLSGIEGPSTTAGKADADVIASDSATSELVGDDDDIFRPTDDWKVEVDAEVEIEDGKNILEEHILALTAEPLVDEAELIPTSMSEVEEESKERRLMSSEDVQSTLVPSLSAGAGAVEDSVGNAVEGSVQQQGGERDAKVGSNTIVALDVEKKLAEEGVEGSTVERQERGASVVSGAPIEDRVISIDTQLPVFTIALKEDQEQEEKDNDEGEDRDGELQALELRKLTKKVPELVPEFDWGVYPPVVGDVDVAIADDFDEYFLVRETLTHAPGMRSQSGKESIVKFLMEWSGLSSSLSHLSPMDLMEFTNACYLKEIPSRLSK
jgi:hypothetical protein